MRRLDKLVFMELLGPWVFGVMIFTVIVMAGTYLFTLTNYIVSGISASVIIEYTLLLMPGIMVKTFSMAVLLAALLAFGRLSSDSEIVALRASSASLPRIMVPVAIFGSLVAVLFFVTNENIVAPAAKRGEALKEEIGKHLHGGSEQVFYTKLTYDDGKTRALIVATDFDYEKKTLTNASVTAFDRKGHYTYVLLAPKMVFDSKDWRSGWRLEPGARVLRADGVSSWSPGQVYPVHEVPTPPNPDDDLLLQLRDLDAMSMSQMADSIRKEERNPGFDKGQLANLKFGYYNKIALPLATIVFGLLGAPLGIRNHRSGAASGFWLSVIIIFAYMMLANLMSIYAMGQVIPSYVASFTPVAIGLVASIILIYRKNR